MIYKELKSTSFCLSSQVNKLSADVTELKEEKQKSENKLQKELEDERKKVLLLWIFFFIYLFLVLNLLISGLFYLQLIKMCNNINLTKSQRILGLYN